MSVLQETDRKDVPKIFEKYGDQFAVENFCRRFSSTKTKRNQFLITKLIENLIKEKRLLETGPFQHLQKVV